MKATSVCTFPINYFSSGYFSSFILFLWHFSIFIAPQYPLFTPWKSNTFPYNNSDPRFYFLKNIFSFYYLFIRSIIWTHNAIPASRHKKITRGRTILPGVLWWLLWFWWLIVQVRRRRCRRWGWLACPLSRTLWFDSPDSLNGIYTIHHLKLNWFLTMLHLCYRGHLLSEIQHKLEESKELGSVR